MYCDVHTHRRGRSEFFSICSYDCSELLVLGCPPSFPNYPFSVGLHPYYLETEVSASSRERLPEILRAPCCLAIGECGLDHSIEVGLPQQISAFERQIFLSEEFSKPLILHIVGAWAELLSIRKDVRPTQPWIVHGFRKKPGLAEQLLAQGLYLSFGAEYNADSLRLADEAGLRLCETDLSELEIETVYDRHTTTLAIEPSEFARRTLAACSQIWSEGYIASCLASEF